VVLFDTTHARENNIKTFLRKTFAICGRFYLTKDFSFFLFSFFLLSLFAPLNGIQQLEDISDTQVSGSFYLPFCALRAQLSNLFAKRIVIPFCKHELHA